MVSKKAILVTITVFATLFLCELLLRVFGYKPGVFSKQDGFTQVDSLINYNNFTTDESGIYKFSSLVTDSIRKYYSCENEEIQNQSVKDQLYPVDRVEDIYNTFCRLLYPENNNTIRLRFKHWINSTKPDQLCEFERTLQQVTSQPLNTNDEWAQAIKEYAQRPFNEEGFRSIAYKNYKTKRPKVLLIGDSFVYGMSANPFTNSFSDILLARGYLIYTAGIPGTDPAQYASIARKYIPLLKPDITIVCFYMGNDVMNFFRPTVQFQPHEHITNAGFFDSYPLGHYLNPSDAYNYYTILATIPSTESNFFNRLCAQSCIGTILWNVCYKYNWVSHPHVKEYENFHYRNPNPNFSRYYIQTIDSIGTANASIVLHAIIPQFDASYNTNRKFLSVDSGLLNQIFLTSFYYPPNLSATVDYAKTDYHFNNIGSIKFANFLDTLIQHNGKQTP